MQTVKTIKKNKIDVKKLALSAMFAALITVATAFIKIPAPLGYAHAGDSMVFLAASVLPAPLSFIAAAVGGALADLLSGYAVWALPTALIKALNVLPFFLARIILSVTVGGYYLANLLLYDQNAALAEIPFNIMQSLVGAVLFAALGAALDAIGLKRKCG